MVAQANMAANASGTLGRYPATRSPTPTSAARRPVRTRATRSDNSAQVSWRGGRVCERATTATEPLPLGGGVRARSA